MTSNLAVVRGTVPSEPQLRDLPSGGVAQFDVITRVETAGRKSNQAVPVAWYDPRPTMLAAITPGTDVVVIGTVRRRFFRVGGATQSRTEVVADVIVPARRRKQVEAALRKVADRLAG